MKTIVACTILIVFYSIFQLVGGEFDIEANFVIQDPKNVLQMLNLLKECSETLQVGLTLSQLQMTQNPTKIPYILQILGLSQLQIKGDILKILFFFLHKNMWVLIRSASARCF